MSTAILIYRLRWAPLNLFSYWNSLNSSFRLHALCISCTPPDALRKKRSRAATALYMNCTLLNVIYGLAMSLVHFTCPDPFPGSRILLSRFRGCQIWDSFLALTSLRVFRSQEEWVAKEIGPLPRGMNERTETKQRWKNAIRLPDICKNTQQMFGSLNSCVLSSHPCFCPVFNL